MEFRPILSTLRRHRTTAALLVLEVALTCAIVCNATFLIGDRLDRIAQPSGMAESELVRIQLSGIGAPGDNRSRLAQDVDLLRRLPGVKGATLVNMVPFGNSSWNSSIRLSPEQSRQSLNAAMYGVAEGFTATTGVRFIAGRDFAADEYRDYVDALESGGKPNLPSVVLNRAAAQRLFPAGDALGKSVYIYDSPSRVIGIVEELARPNNSRNGPYSMMLPVRMNRGAGHYLLRVDSSQRDALRKAAVAALLKADPMRVVVKQDAAMARLLAAVCIAMLVVTALGIVGLASFWVQQRSRMIGVRRALGATRAQIRGYFQTENLLLTGAGIVLGMASAYGINLLLMAHYELPRLPLFYLPIGALALLLLGQLAVLGPARRAAALPPMVVMRMN